MTIQNLIDNGYISNFEFEKNAINIELNDAHYDLEKAKKSFEEEDYKWTVIQAYYSIFHICRALLYKNNFREKSHYGLYLYIEQLHYQQQFPEKFVNMFKAGLFARQEANYQGTFSKETAENILNFAIEFKEFEKYLKD